jgi:two-component system LytT family sensor kinase
VGNLPWWLCWALLTPLAVALARRFRVDGPRRLGALAVHLVAAVALSLAHLALTGTLYFYTITRHDAPLLPATVARPASPWALLEGWLDTFLVVDVLTYCAILGGWYALEYHRRLRERELAAFRLEARAAALEAQMAAARLDALRMELNPHFLFNALNAAAGLVRRGEQRAAVETLARLGDLLRLTLECGRGPRGERAHEIPLEEELEVLGLYLAIEQVRFPDRLTVEIDVPADARAAPVPALLLQPLVENAIRHGVAPLPGPGRVRITAHLRDDALELVVEDTGPGFPVGRAHRTGIGLANTRDRLAQLYGERAALRIGDAPEGGAVVTVTLPRGAAPAVVPTPSTGRIGVAIPV